MPRRRQSSGRGLRLTLALPMVSSLAKLCVHQILVLLRPFFGLSVAAEGWEGEEGAAAGPSPGRGARDPLPQLAEPLTWLPEMSGAEGMRCRASRCWSIPVSSCSLAWHSDSSARGTEVREGAQGPCPAPSTPSGLAHPPSSAPAPRCPSARRSPCPGSWPAPTGQGHCPRAGSASTGPAAGHGGHQALSGATCPGTVTPSCHPPACRSPRDPPGDTAPAARRGGGRTGCSPSWRTPPGT